MKITSALLLSLTMLALLPQAAVAEGKRYIGVAMFNSHYRDDVGNHRSTGLVARAGYALTPRLAVEGHVGGSIGGESGANPDEIQAQLSQLYGVYARLGAPIKFGTLSLLGGYSYGTRETRLPGGASTTESAGSPSLGAGIEVSDDGRLGFVFDVMRYFHGSDFSVDAWNLGLVVRF